MGKRKRGLQAPTEERAMIKFAMFTLALLLVAGPALAGVAVDKGVVGGVRAGVNVDREARIAGLEARINELLAEADELDAMGMVEDAADLRADAEDLMKDVAELQAELDEEEELEAEELEEEDLDEDLEDLEL